MVQPAESVEGPVYSLSCMQKMHGRAFDLSASTSPACCRVFQAGICWSSRTPIKIVKARCHWPVALQKRQLTKLGIAVLVQQDIASLQVQVQDGVGLHVVQIVQTCSSAVHRISPDEHEDTVMCAGGAAPQQPEWCCAWLELPLCAGE